MIPLHPRLGALEPSLIRKVFQAAPPGCINMGLGMPDLKVPSPVIDAVRAELDTGLAPYTANAGRAELREAIAAFYRHRADQGEQVGRWFETEGTIVTVGTEEGLFVALASLCGEGDAVLVPDPGFPAYAMIARVLGAEPVPYDCGPEQGFRPRAAAIESALTDRTRAVVLGSPGNPTGTMAEADDLREITAMLEARGVPWVSDEIYDLFAYGKPFVSPSAFSKAGFVLGGLSKSAAMMGWRLGWLLVPAESAEVVTRVHQTVCTCASTLSQAAGLAAVRGMTEGGPVFEAIGEGVSVFAERRSKARALLAAYGLRTAPSDGAFYLFVDVRDRLRDGEDDLGLCMRLLDEQKLIAIPGQGFGPRGVGWVRLAITTAAVEEGVRRFIAGLEKP